eukprot:COSAG02_NODE_653_length_18827_cov_44.237826_10_plen_218_part_00
MRHHRGSMQPHTGVKSYLCRLSVAHACTQQRPRKTRSSRKSRADMPKRGRYRGIPSTNGKNQRLHGPPRAIRRCLTRWSPAWVGRIVANLCFCHPACAPACKQKREPALMRHRASIASRNLRPSKQKSLGDSTQNRADTHKQAADNCTARRRANAMPPTTTHLTVLTARRWASRRPRSRCYCCAATPVQTPHVAPPHLEARLRPVGRSQGDQVTLWA